MKIYEVNNTIGRTYYASKAAATGAHRIGKFEHGEDVTTTEVEFNLTKKGVVSMLNSLSYVPPQPETCTVNRVPPPSYTKGETAEQPPPSMSPKVIDQLEAWGLGELAKKCSATREWLDDKEAEPPSVNPDTGEHDDAGRSAFDGAGGECILCGGTYSGWGHNPEPVVPFEKGRCCGVCNTLSVIPARLAMLGARNKA